MSVPINTRGLFDNLIPSQPAPSTAGARQAPRAAQPAPSQHSPFTPGGPQTSAQSSTATAPAQPSAPLAPGIITPDANALRQWDTTRPILRFDFPTPEAQATFHRAFAQIRTEKDKAQFMTRFFDNYDAQVQIPRRVIMNTSRDDAMAREVQERMGVVMETGNDAALAQEIQRGLAPILETGMDEEIARRLQGRTPVPARMERDEEMARRMQQRDEARRRNEALNDEAIARRMQQQMERENAARGYGGRTHNSNVGHRADRLGGMGCGGREPQRAPSQFDRRRPQGGGGNGHSGTHQPGRNSGYGQPSRNAGYGQPGPGQYYHDDEDEQWFGDRMEGYGPGYGGRGYRRGGY